MSKSLGDLKWINNLKRERQRGELCEQSLSVLLTFVALTKSNPIIFVLGKRNVVKHLSR